jgi:hypothetical protein
MAISTGIAPNPTTSTHAARTRRTTPTNSTARVATAFAFNANFADPNQIRHFQKNLAIAGGLLHVVVVGSGRYSVGVRRAVCTSLPDATAGCGAGQSLCGLFGAAAVEPLLDLYPHPGAGTPMQKRGGRSDVRGDLGVGGPFARAVPVKAGPGV